MNPKLLIVDDDSDQLAKAKRAAREAGFGERDIVAVTTAIDAEANMETQSFDVAVVDLVLTLSPSDSSYHEDGLELIAHIRRQQPDCQIIALTTKLDTDVGIRAMVAGAVDFVSSKWLYINWEELLVQRLRLWRGVAKLAHV